MRAGWMPSGACASSSTAPPRGGTRRASGGAATTNTAYAARRSYSSGAAAEWHWVRRMTGFSPASCLLRHPKVDPEAFGNLGVGACQPCGDDEPCRKSSCRLERHPRPSDPPRWGSRRRFEFFQMGRAIHFPGSCPRSRPGSAGRKSLKGKYFPFIGRYGVRRIGAFPCPPAISSRVPAQAGRNGSCRCIWRRGWRWG